MAVSLSVEPKVVFHDQSEPVEVSVQIANQADVIDSYSIRVLGVDPDWVTGAEEALQLFPGDSGFFELCINLPSDFPAGEHTLTLQCRSAVFPERILTSGITVIVESVDFVTLDVYPNRAISGKKTEFVLTAANYGNSDIWLELEADDPEALTEVQFSKPRVHIKRQEEATVEVQVQGPRPWVGQPASRVLTLGAKNIEDVAPQLFNFVQKPKLGRWLFSFFGLMITCVIFGLVLHNRLANFGNQVTLDPNILENAFVTGSGNSAAGDSFLQGSVLDLRTRSPLHYVTIKAYDPSDMDTVVSQGVSEKNGTFELRGLNKKRTYKLLYAKAGYQDTWSGFVDDPARAKEIIGRGVNQPMFLEGESSSLTGLVGGSLVDAVDVELLIAPETLFLTDDDSDVVISSTQTDSEGLYLFDSLPTGRYRVRASAPGLGTKYSPYFDLTPDEVEQVPELSLQEGDGGVSGKLFKVVDNQVVPVEDGTIVSIKSESMSKRFEVAAPNPTTALRLVQRVLPTSQKFYKAGESLVMSLYDLPSDFVPSDLYGNAKAMLPGDEMQLEVCVSICAGGSQLEDWSLRLTQRSKILECQDTGNVAPSGDVLDTKRNGKCGFKGFEVGEVSVEFRASPDQTFGSLRTIQIKADQVLELTIVYEEANGSFYLKPNLIKNVECTIEKGYSGCTIGSGEEGLRQLYASFENADGKRLFRDVEVVFLSPEKSQTFDIDVNKFLALGSADSTQPDPPTLSRDSVTVMLSDEGGTEKVVPRGRNVSVFAVIDKNVVSSCVIESDDSSCDLDVAYLTETPSDLWVYAYGVSNWWAVEKKIVAPEEGVKKVRLVVEERQANYLTAATGTFSFEGLPTPGRYQLEVQSGTNFRTAAIDINLVSGQVVTDLNIVVNPSAGAICGKVSNQNGKAIDGVTIEVSDGVDIWTGVTLQGFVERSCGQNSLESINYILPKLPVPGEYRLTFTRPGYETSIIDVLLTDLGPVRIRNVYLTSSTAQLSGVVKQCTLVTAPGVACPTSSLTNKDLAEVALSNGSITFDTFTASRCVTKDPLKELNDSCTGSYYFADIPVGQYSVTAAVKGAVSESSSVRLQPGVARQENFDLSLSSTVKVQVCSSFPALATATCASPKQGWQVRMYSETAFPNGIPAVGVVPANGTETNFAGLDAPQRYVLTAAGVSNGNSSNFSYSFALGAGEEVTLVCVPPVAGSVPTFACRRLTK